MSDIGRGNIRVSIDGTFHDLYKELSDGNGPEKAPFRTMKDVFMLAACLGFRRGERKPLSGRKQQIFHWAQFSEQVDAPILKAIAISTTNDILVLAHYDQIVQIAEEYANGGIHEIASQIKSGVSQPLWTITELVRV